MSKNNSNSKGRNKSRYNGTNNNRSNGMPSSRNAVFDSNGPCGKIRGNISQIIEKYQAAAKDANSQSEHVLAELCMQYADHYNRINLSFIDIQKKQQKPDEKQQDNNTSDASNTPEKENITQQEKIEEIDISGMDLSIPDFTMIKKEKPKAKKETVKLAIENA